MGILSFLESIGFTFNIYNPEIQTCGLIKY